MKSRGFHKKWSLGGKKLSKQSVHVWSRCVLIVGSQYLWGNTNKRNKKTNVLLKLSLHLTETQNLYTSVLSLSMCHLFCVIMHVYIYITFAALWSSGCISCLWFCHAAFFFHAIFSFHIMCMLNKNVAHLLKHGSGTINHMQMLSSIKIQSDKNTKDITGRCIVFLGHVSVKNRALTACGSADV